MAESTDVQETGSSRAMRWRFYRVRPLKPIPLWMGPTTANIYLRYAMCIPRLQDIPSNSLNLTYTFGPLLF